MPIPDQILDEIQNKVNIVEVISAYVPLKKAGRNYKGLCPFHHEKTPSFMVSQDKQIYHCFGCGAGGNAFSFLMRQERLEFPEAVRLLAEKAGIRLPSSSYGDKASSSLANKIYEVNELACSFYQANLAGDKDASGYLNSRGIGQEAVKSFRLGIAPKAWDGLLNFLKAKGVSLEIIEKAGLIIPSDRGGHYDRFRERVTFPIFDLRSRILGFGARVMDSSLPKYVNSPETVVYSKGQNLYGFNFSKEDIKKANYAIVVEGYMDFILPFQAGVRNIVATLGTALTGDQARLLKRFAKTCVIVYDPDEAGESASLRNLDIFIKEGLGVYIAALKKGYDPDSFVRNFGVEGFREVIKEAKNLFDYKLELLSQRFNPNDIHGKVEIAQEMLPTIAKIDNAILQSSLIKRLGQALSIDEDSLRVELKKVKTDYSHRPSKAQTPRNEKGKETGKAEKMLLGMMLEDRDFIKRSIDIIKPEEFRDDAMREIIKVLFSYDPEAKMASVASSLLSHFKDNEDVCQIVLEAASLNEAISDSNKVFVDCVETIKKGNIRLQLAALQDAIRKAHASKDDKALKELLSKYNSLVKA